MPAAVFSALSTTITNRLKRNGLTVFAEAREDAGRALEMLVEYRQKRPCRAAEHVGRVRAVGRQEMWPFRPGAAGSPAIASRTCVYRLPCRWRASRGRVRLPILPASNSIALMCVFGIFVIYWLRAASRPSMRTSARVDGVWGSFATSSPLMLVCLTAPLAPHPRLVLAFHRLGALGSRGIAYLFISGCCTRRNFVQRNQQIRALSKCRASKSSMAPRQSCSW